MLRRVGVALALAFVGACSSHTAPPTATTSAPSASPTPTVPSETAVGTETNPVGDIPDSTQFVNYHSTAGHYTLTHPEGWAQRANGSGVMFSDKEHSITVALTSASGPRTPGTTRSMDEPQVRSSVPAFEEVKIATATLPGGPAVLFRYRMNSAPDPVTGKKVRLEVDRYEIYSSGRLAILSLSAPAGSDNVDVWNKVSQSFVWS